MKNLSQEANADQSARLLALADQLDQVRRSAFDAQRGDAAPETAAVREARQLLAAAQTLLERASAQANH